MLQILSTSNETSTGPELVQNGDFSELGSDLVKNGDFSEVGSELITNGDFSAVPLGSELVTDGNFPTPNVNWSLSSSFSIANNKLHCVSDGTYEFAYQSSVFEIGKSYVITFDITGWTLGTIRVRPTAESPFQTASANGSYSFFYVAVDNTQLIIERDGACDMYLENISVKEATNLITNPNFSATGSELIVDGDFPLPNVNWQVLPSATINGGSATIEGLGSLTTTGNYWGVSQDVTGHAVGKSYKVTFTAKQLTGVGVMYGGIGFVNQFSQVITSEYVTYTFYQTITTSGTPWNEVAFGGVLATGAEATNTFEIKDVSVKELGEDWTVVDDTNTFGANGLTMTSTEGADVKIYQPNVITSSKSYKVTYTIHENGLTGSNTLQYYTGDATLSYEALPEQSEGTHTFYYTAPSVANDRWYFKLNLAGGSTSTTDFVTISSIIVQELGEGWTGNTNGGFLINGSGLSLDSSVIDTSGGGTVYSALTQYGTIIEIGKSYKLVIDNLDITSGNIELKFGLDHTTTPVRPVLTSADNGTYTDYFTAQTLNDGFTINSAAGTIATLSSISVKEVGQDWTVENTDATHYVEFYGGVGGARFVSGALSPILTLRQDVVSIGKYYKITCDATYGVGSGKARFQIGSINTSSIEEGSNVLYISQPTTSDNSYILRDGVDVDVVITNVSIQQLDPNGYWALNSNWSIGEGAIADGTSSAAIFQSNVVEDNKTYSVSYKLTDFTQGTLHANLSGTSGVSRITSNDYTEIIKASTSPSGRLDFTGTGDFIVTLDNVSVKQLGTYEDQSIYVTAADVQTIPQASVYYLVELTSMASKNSIYFLPSSVVPNNGRYTKLNFTVVSKDALPTPASGIISFYDSVGGFDTYPMGFYEFRIYEQTSSTNLDPTLATGLLEKGFAFVRDFSGNMQELTDGFKEYNPTLTQYVYSK